MPLRSARAAPPRTSPVTLFALALALGLLLLAESANGATLARLRTAERLSKATRVVKRDNAKAVGYALSGSRYCSVSVIAKQWVLFAAHCPLNAKDKVIIGKHHGSKGTEHHVTFVKRHEQFVMSTFRSYHDIAVAKVDPPILTDAVMRLNKSPSMPAKEKSVLALGYGGIDHKGTGSRQLRRARFVALSHNQCVAKVIQAKFPTTAQGLHSKVHLCANERKLGVGVCAGDSGGPLVVTPPPGSNDFWLQVGISSFFLPGETCGDVNRPDVYTRVSTYEPWIRFWLETTDGKGKVAGLLPSK